HHAHRLRPAGGRGGRDVQHVWHAGRPAMGPVSEGDGRCHKDPPAAQGDHRTGVVWRPFGRGARPAAACCRCRRRPDGRRVCRRAARPGCRGPPKVGAGPVAPVPDHARRGAAGHPAVVRRAAVPLRGARVPQERHRAAHKHPRQAGHGENDRHRGRRRHRRRDAVRAAGVVCRDSRARVCAHPARKGPRRPDQRPRAAHRRLSARQGRHRHLGPRRLHRVQERPAGAGRLAAGQMAGPGAQRDGPRRQRGRPFPPDRGQGQAVRVRVQRIAGLHRQRKGHRAAAAAQHQRRHRRAVDVDILEGVLPLGALVRPQQSLRRNRLGEARHVWAHHDCRL
ncbi:hypothetical protein IWQ57_005483, partial [Coemansia nantahalensis]